jgi:hypothetical protein
MTKFKYRVYPDTNWHLSQEEHDSHNETKMKLQQAELEIALLKQQLDTAKWSLRYEQQLRAGESWSYSK